LREKSAQKGSYVQILEEKLRLMLAKTFAPSSEKVSPDQRGLFNEAADEVDQCLEAEDTETTVVASHQFDINLVYPVLQTNSGTNSFSKCYTL
jgi:hypothetical protein